MAPAYYWQKAPLGWRDAPAVVALASRVRRRDPRLLLLDLWEWAKVHGTQHKLALAVEALERGAGWRGKRGVLYASLVETGFVREQDGCAVILDWDEDEIIAGRKTLPGVVPAGTSLPDEDVKRANDRARQQASRERKKKSDVTPDAVTRHNDVTEKNVTDRDKDFSDPSNRPESPVYAGFVTAQEEEKEKEQERENTKSVAPPENPVSADGKEKSFTLAVEPSKPKRGRPPKDPAAHAAERADADRWLARVRDITGLGEDIMCWSQGHFLAWKALRKKHGMETLMLALDGLENDKFYRQRGNLGLFVSANAVQSGVAAAQQRRAYRGQDINDVWERIEREENAKREVANG